MTTPLMNRRTLGHRAPLLWVLLPLMAGLTAGKLQCLPLTPVWWASVAVLVTGIALIWRRAGAVGLVLGVFLSGATLFELRLARLNDWAVLPPREVRVTLEIDRVFTPKPGQKSVAGLAHIRSADPHLTELAGQSVYFSVSRKELKAVPIRSSQLAVVGVLQSLPRTTAENTFDGYLVNQGVNFKLTRGRVRAEVSPARAYPAFCDRMLQRLNAILGHGLERHPEQAGVLRAMLLGQQQELSAAQKVVFRTSGTMHLFSISGLHIAVIAAIIHGGLALCRLTRWVRFIAGGVLLWLYVDITGCTPSAVRAFLMVLFLHAAPVLRLPNNPIAALIGSAVVVLIWQPLQLFSASFQLSYGIVAALLLLGLPLGEYWNEKTAPFKQLPKVTWAWPHHSIDWAWRALMGSLAIGAATALISAIGGVVIFNLFTPVSLLANLALIPVGSLVIVSGFLAILSGLVGLTGLVLIFNAASALLLLAIDWAVIHVVRLPGAFAAAEFSPSWIGYTALAGLMGLIFLGYASGWERKRGGFWLPFGFTLLALGFGMRFLPAT